MKKKIGNYENHVSNYGHEQYNKETALRQSFKIINGNLLTRSKSNLLITADKNWYALCMTKNAVKEKILQCRDLFQSNIDIIKMNSRLIPYIDENQDLFILELPRHVRWMFYEPFKEVKSFLENIQDIVCDETVTISDLVKIIKIYWQTENYLPENKCFVVSWENLEQMKQNYENHVPVYFAQDDGDDKEIAFLKKFPLPNIQKCNGNAIYRSIYEHIDEMTKEVLVERIGIFEIIEEIMRVNRILIWKGKSASLPLDMKDLYHDHLGGQKIHQVKDKWLQLYYLYTYHAVSCSEENFFSCLLCNDTLLTISDSLCSSIFEKFLEVLDAENDKEANISLRNRIKIKDISEKGSLYDCYLSKATFNSCDLQFDAYHNRQKGPHITYFQTMEDILKTYTCHADKTPVELLIQITTGGQKIAIPDRICEVYDFCQLLDENNYCEVINVKKNPWAISESNTNVLPENLIVASDSYTFYFLTEKRKTIALCLSKNNHMNNFCVQSVVYKENYYEDSKYIKNQNVLKIEPSAFDVGHSLSNETINTQSNINEHCTPLLGLVNSSTCCKWDGLPVFTDQELRQYPDFYERIYIFDGSIICKDEYLASCEGNVPCTGCYIFGNIGYWLSLKKVQAERRREKKTFGETRHISDSMTCKVCEQSPVVTSGSAFDCKMYQCLNFQTCKSSCGIVTASGICEQEKVHQSTETKIEEKIQYHNCIVPSKTTRVWISTNFQPLNECLNEVSYIDEEEISILRSEESKVVPILESLEEYISMKRILLPDFERTTTPFPIDNQVSSYLTSSSLSSCHSSPNLEDVSSDCIDFSSLSSQYSDNDDKFSDTSFLNIHAIPEGSTSNTAFNETRCCISHADKSSIEDERKEICSNFDDTCIEKNILFEDLNLNSGNAILWCESEEIAKTVCSQTISEVNFESTHIYLLVVGTILQINNDLDKWLNTNYLGTRKNFSDIEVQKNVEELAHAYRNCFAPYLQQHDVYTLNRTGIEEFYYKSVHPSEKCLIWNAKTPLKQTRQMMDFVDINVKKEGRKFRLISSNCYIHYIKDKKSTNENNSSIDSFSIVGIKDSGVIHLGKTEVSYPLDLEEFLSFMEIQAKQSNNKKEISKQLKQLLQKFNVKSTIARSKTKVGRSKKSRICRHARRLSLEQLMKYFFKYMDTDFPVKSTTPSSKSLYKQVFNYLPFRYENKFFVYPINGLQKYFDQMSVPLASRPAHAETMKFEWVRVRSFWSFPSNIKVSPIAMARVGFYYTGKCAECRCFSCGHVYKEWKDGDDPYLIHQQISPTCFYLNGRESGNVPIHEEDRITPRHHIDQSLVTVMPPVNAGRSAALAEAVQVPGISSTEISQIPVPSQQQRPLTTSQSGDFSFRLQTSQAIATTQSSTANQMSPSYFARPELPTQNVQSSKPASLEPTVTNQGGITTPSLSQSSGQYTTSSQPATQTAQVVLPSIPQTTLPAGQGTPGLAPSVQFNEGSGGSRSTPVTTSVPQAMPIPSQTAAPAPSPVTTNTTATTTTSSTEVSSSTSTSSPSRPPQATTSNTSTSTASSSSTTVGSESSRSRFDPLGINFEKPRYPAYAVLAVRVNTYNGWPSYLDQTPRTMSLAGFFYAGYGDYTRCFFCGGGLRNWEAGDDPWVEHARWFPKCAFLRQNRGDSFVTMVQTRHQEAESTNQPIMLLSQLSVLDEARPANIMASIPVQTLREMGKDDTIINEAIDRWRTQRQGTGSTNAQTEMQATEIYEIILQIEDERALSVQPSIGQQSLLVPPPGSSKITSLVSAQGAGQLTTGPITEQAIAAGTSEELPQYLQGFDKILDEYEEQKERLTCTICTENPVAIAFLPCGHLVCCLDCAPAMRKCPICNELVKGTIKTFFP